MDERLSFEQLAHFADGVDTMILVGLPVGFLVAVTVIWTILVAIRRIKEREEIGPTVNLASRLESMTKAFGVRVMIEPKAAAALAAVDPRGVKFRTRKLATVCPAGMSKGVALFELLPPEHAPGTNLKEAVRRSWEEAVGWYAAGEWKRARERFQSFFANDPVAQMLLKEMGVATNPPSGWDGVLKMTVK